MGGINWNPPHIQRKIAMAQTIQSPPGIYYYGRQNRGKKKWVAERIGEKYIIPTLGVWTKAEEVDFDTLPDKFVIKCNHNSGTGMYICKDKQQMDDDRKSVTDYAPDCRKTTSIIMESGRTKT